MEERNLRKVMVGTVKSNKMDKTVVVAVETNVSHGVLFLLLAGVLLSPELSNNSSKSESVAAYTDDVTNVSIIATKTTKKLFKIIDFFILPLLTSNSIFYFFSINNYYYITLF